MHVVQPQEGTDQLRDVKMQGDELHVASQEALEAVIDRWNALLLRDRRRLYLGMGVWVVSIGYRLASYGP